MNVYATKAKVPMRKNIFPLIAPSSPTSKSGRMIMTMTPIRLRVVPTITLLFTLSLRKSIDPRMRKIGAAAAMIEALRLDDILSPTKSRPM